MNQIHESNFIKNSLLATNFIDNNQTKQKYMLDQGWSNSNLRLLTLKKKSP